MTLQPATTRYQEVKHFILDRIAAGSLRAGERVPSENELTRTLTVSRMTANRALRELAEDGVLVRVAGVGTFVAEQRVHAHPLEVRNIADEIRARGHEHRLKVVALQSVAASRELAERFVLRPGAPLVLETLNPACWLAFFSSYLRDFTHIWPVHPETLQYLLHASGFSRVEIKYTEQAPDAVRMKGVDPLSLNGLDPATFRAVKALADAYNANASILNNLLFTYMDYSVIGYR